MTSRVNPNFPIPGIDQSSRGFRDNFAIIKNELDNIQNKNIQLVGDVTSDPVIFGNDTTDIHILTTINLANLAINGSVIYKGTWNATTNSPSLASSIGIKGWYYVVSVAGTTNINGISIWNIGDWIIFDGSIWEKVDNQTPLVLSVAGKIGVVNLVVGDVAGAAPNASPTFTGVPSAPTAISSTNTTQLATTSFVHSLVGTGNIVITGDATGYGSGTIPITLANTSVVSGTYTKLTVNSKGLITAGQSASTTDLADVLTGSLSNNQILTYNFSSSKWVNSNAPYDVYGTFLGKPTDAQILWRIVIGRAITFPIHLTGSVAVCSVAPTSSVTIPILQNGSQIGSIDFANGQTIGTFTFPSQVVFATSDTLEINGPSPVDFAFFSPSWAFIGYR